MTLLEQASFHESLENRRSREQSLTCFMGVLYSERPRKVDIEDKFPEFGRVFGFSVFLICGLEDSHLLFWIEGISRLGHCLDTGCSYVFPLVRFVRSQLWKMYLFPNSDFLARFVIGVLTGWRG